MGCYRFHGSSRYIKAKPVVSFIDTIIVFIAGSTTRVYYLVEIAIAVLQAVAMAVVEAVIAVVVMVDAAMVLFTLSGTFEDSLDR